MGDDELALIFACCHPALDRGVRVPLMLRSAGGLEPPAAERAFIQARIRALARSAGEGS